MMRVQKIMTTPIKQVFEFLKVGARIQLWLYEDTKMRIEGKLIGFDEYMNVVLDDAVEVYVKKNVSKSIGRIMLKGDNIALVREVSK
ncbi:small nuclear ribonucleoprotein E [Acrasis kona]|uniref:Small nuclear ribonucleoprotein E n=1 Tax=Acrasis kona TaxID=1008807 RepID=A0AAW2ZM31_9EUKA